jgi:hypothetical protein
MNSPLPSPIPGEPPAPTGRRFRIALYRTDGNRRKQHLVVLYLGADCDWTDIQRTRNGNKSWGLLATAPETPDVVEYREAGPRAASLQYSGAAPADLSGLENDMEGFGYDPDTVTRFVEAARPCFTTPHIPESRKRKP